MNRPYDGGPMLLNIPSPSGRHHIGPFELHVYGLMLALGVLVAAKITEWRWTKWGHNGRGDRRDRHPGRDRRRHRRAPVPRVHRLQLRRRRARRHVQDLEGRALDLGRGRRRRDRGRHHRRGQAPRHACCSPTRSRPGSWSRRRSAAGATSSTRSCSAGRRTCRGGSRSTARTDRPSYVAERHVPADVPVRVALVPRSSSARSSCSRRKRGLRRGQTFALYVVHVHVRPLLLRGDAHRSRARGRRHALQPAALRRCCASSSAIWFVWLGRHGPATPSERRATMPPPTSCSEPPDGRSIV